jgi:hypothetical protein
MIVASSATGRRAVADVRVREDEVELRYRAVVGLLALFSPARSPTWSAGELHEGDDLVETEQEIGQRDHGKDDRPASRGRPRIRTRCRGAAARVASPLVRGRRGGRHGPDSGRPPLTAR